jgi:predicted HTH domain antitoxin
MTTPKARNKAVSLRVPEALLDIATMLSKDQDIDRSKILIQWLYEGTEDVVIELLEQGKISKGYAVKALDTTYYDLNGLLEAREIRLGPGNEQIKKSKETARLPQLKHCAGS